MLIHLFLCTDSNLHGLSIFLNGVLSVNGFKCHLEKNCWLERENSIIPKHLNLCPLCLILTSEERTNTWWWLNYQCIEINFFQIQSFIPKLPCHLDGYYRSCSWSLVVVNRHFAGDLRWKLLPPWPCCLLRCKLMCTRGSPCEVLNDL